MPSEQTKTAAGKPQSAYDRALALRTTDAKAALAAAKEAYAESPGYVRTKQLLGVLLLPTDRARGEALLREVLAEYDDHLALIEDDASILYAKACILALLGQSREALRTLTAAFEVDPGLRERAATDADLASLKALQLLLRRKPAPPPVRRPVARSEQDFIERLREELAGGKVVFSEVPRASWHLCLCVAQSFTLPAKHVPEALSRLAAETRPPAKSLEEVFEQQGMTLVRSERGDVVHIDGWTSGKPFGGDEDPFELLGQIPDLVKPGSLFVVVASDDDRFWKVTFQHKRMTYWKESGPVPPGRVTFNGREA